MWLLRNDLKGLLYRVTPGKQHNITRKDGDLILLGDQSISRKHAQVQVDEENEANGIIVKDLGSKYGTFTIIGGGEWVQLLPNQETTLRNGDSVRFGIQWNCWRAEFNPLLVVASTLTQEEKSDVKQVVESLGGRVVSEWQAQCSHLTMSKLTVTIKVVCALASGQPIVTPSFWKSFSEAVSTTQSTLPDCNNFLPPLAEAMLNPSEVSFAPNPARSKLFQGLTFVAATAKQLNRIRPMISAAGGKAVEFCARLWTEDRLTKDDKTILMLSSASDKPGSQQSQVFDGYIPVARKLRSKGIRCIPESEIGLSVLHCSMNQFCNPRFSNQALISSSSSAQATQHVTVICPNSEDSMEIDQDNVNTEPGPNAQNSSKKRILEDVNRNEEPLNKKADLRRNSGDLFDSQNLNNSKANIVSNLNLKKTECPTKTAPKNPAKRNPDPSLDMFASLGEKSGPSNAFNQSAVAPSSKDMFASSGEKSGPSDALNQIAVSPSCEDMFASTGSRQLLKKGSKDTASTIISFPSRINVDTPSNKDSNGGEDEFSFASIRSKKANKEQEDAIDEFSFKSNKTSNITLQTESDEEDAFSFSSVRRPNKRNRQSNPDMFASSAESSINNSLAKPTKSLDTFSFKNVKPNDCGDSLFAFPDDHNPKRRRIIGDVVDFNLGGEVKIALLSNGCTSEPEPSRLQGQKDCEDLPEPKNLTTYSKSNLKRPTIKQEIEDEEMDELAKELYDSTIVVVKPLLVAREAPQQSKALPTGKNFKKFRKVVGINKRIVPHIIGGSDLVSHYNVGQDLNEKDPLPVQNVFDEDNDDEWTFNQNKIKKRVH